MSDKKDRPIIDDPPDLGRRGFLRRLGSAVIFPTVSPYLEAAGELAGLVSASTVVTKALGWHPTNVVQSVLLLERLAKLDQNLSAAAEELTIDVIAEIMPNGKEAFLRSTSEYIDKASSSMCLDLGHALGELPNSDLASIFASRDFGEVYSDYTGGKIFDFAGQKGVLETIRELRTEYLDGFELVDADVYLKGTPRLDGVDYPSMMLQTREDDVIAKNIADRFKAKLTPHYEEFAKKAEEVARQHGLDINESILPERVGVYKMGAKRVIPEAIIDKEHRKDTRQICYRIILPRSEDLQSKDDWNAATDALIQTLKKIFPANVEIGKDRITNGHIFIAPDWDAAKEDSDVMDSTIAIDRYLRKESVKTAVKEAGTIDLMI